MVDDSSARCIDCAHWDREHGCEAASERLRLEGWPAAQVRPPAAAWASGCPGFEPHEDHAALVEEARAARRELWRCAAARGHRLAPGPLSGAAS